MPLSRMPDLLVRRVRILKLHDWSPKGVLLLLLRVRLPVHESIGLQNRVRPTRAQKRGHLGTANEFKGSMSLRRLWPRSCQIEFRPKAC